MFLANLCVDFGVFLVLFDIVNLLIYSILRAFLWISAIKLTDTDKMAVFFIGFGRTFLVLK